MSKSKKSIGVVGFPSIYGGAGVELNHQLTLWKEMDLDVHVVPTWNASGEALYNKTLHRATIHKAKDYSALKGMPVISFCNDVFLTDIAKIKEQASKTIFVNCMTWLFNDEKKAHKEGLIDLFLYQSHRTQGMGNDKLKEINENYNWKIFNSFFDAAEFPFHYNRPRDKFRFGRISREDGDKYSKDQMFIYHNMVAPVGKSGIILGFDKRSEKKIGTPPDWIRTYPGNGITVQEFYAHSSCVIQKADTTENWPRVGMEAMASGSILIVDKRGGWEEMVEHGVTGWLCESDRDMIYYSSRMAYEHEEREIMALKAKERGKQLFGKGASKESWKEVFEL